MKNIYPKFYQRYLDDTYYIVQGWISSKEGQEILSQTNIDASNFQ